MDTERPNFGNIEEGSMEKHYTLEDLEKARAELELWQERWANSSSNNPNKFRSQREWAAGRVREIEQDLKERGLLDKTDWEKINAELDKIYPNAKSRTVVEYQGKKYQISYFPLETSRSGKTVHEWGHRWISLEDREGDKETKE